MRLSIPSAAALRRPLQHLRWRPSPNFAVASLAALAALCLCYLLAGLLAQVLAWQSAQPALALPAPPALDNSNARAALSRWFSTAEAPQKANPLAGLQLIAVVAGKYGVALISGIESVPTAYSAGTEIRAGLQLLEVLPDRIILSQDAQRSELAFAPGAEASLITPGASTAPAPSPAAAKPVVPPKEAPVQSSTVSRGQLAGVAQGGNLGDWDKGLANFPDGGIRVSSASVQPLAQVLNLRDGDVIKQVNDKPLNQLADVSLIYHHFSQSQEVNLIILRDGKPQQLNFKIQP